MFRTGLSLGKGRPLIGLTALQALAAQRGGRVLSHTYLNICAPLLWECAKGHQWSAVPNNIVHRGSWCPHCAGNARQTLESATGVAEALSGQCLSVVFKNSRTKLEWQCNFGHIWLATLSNVKDGGTWCPTCAGTQPLTLGLARDIARERFGTCLTEKYQNSRLPMLWRCREGHQWAARLSSVKSGTWCPVCAGKQRLGISAARFLAEERGGVLLSADYTNCILPLRWQCSDGHEWSTSLTSIKHHGSWCPVCAQRHSEGVRERSVRALSQT